MESENQSGRSGLPLQLKILVVAGAIMLVAAAAFWIFRASHGAVRSELLAQAGQVAGRINADDIRPLSGTEADAALPQYLRLKEQLVRAKALATRCRQAYLMGRRDDGRLFYYLDSEPDGSAKETIPRRIHESVPEYFLAAFETGAPFLTGPETDDHGKWAVALVPVRDPITGEPVAMLGMDFHVPDWHWRVLAKAAPAGGVALAFLIGAVSVHISIRRRLETPRPVLQRLLRPLAASLILMGAGAVISLWHIQEHKIKSRVLIMADNVSHSYELIAEQNLSQLGASLKIIASRKDVQNALALGDVDGLQTAWHPLFETMAAENRITHFCFFDKNRRCLLRLHEPGRHGDVIERFTALEAERTGKTASGLELDPQGALVLRSVQPVYRQGELAGYVGLGQDLAAHVGSFDRHLGVKIDVVIRKELLERELWEEEMTGTGRDARWDLLPDHVLYRGYEEARAESWRGWAARVERLLAAHEHFEGDQGIHFQGTPWRITAIPLKDASGGEIGDLLLMYNMVSENAVFRRTVVIGVTVIGLCLLGLLSFIYIVLRHTDAGIRAQQRTLENNTKQLEESNRLLAGVLEHTHVMAAYLDPSFNFVWVNHAYAAADQRPRSFFPGENLFDLCPDPENQAIFQQVLDTGKPFYVEGRPFEHPNHPERGVTYWDWSLIPVRDQEDNVAGLVLTLVDVTTREKARGELVESKSKLEAALASMTDGVFISNNDGRLIEVNDAWISFCRFTDREECLKTLAEYPDLFDVLTDDGDPVPLEMWALPRALRGEQADDAEYTIRRKDTGETWVGAYSFSPIRSEEGTIAGAVVVARDITELKQAAQSRRQLEEKLRQAQKMESIGTLAGGIAHDFNNILFPMIGFAELLKDEVQADSPLQDYIDEILIGANRSRDLVQRILTFSRKGDQVIRPIRLHAVIGEALDLLRPTLPATIDIKREIDTSCGVVLADPTQIHQIVMNLATNAFHAMEEDGGVLTVRLEMVALSPAASPGSELQPGDYALLTVSDTGAGIPATVMDRIFDPYFTTKGAGKGTGLGLSVVLGIVKTHGGDIRIESGSCKGTDIRVYLPIKAQENIPDVSEDDEPVQGGTESVLLVDDEAAVIRMESRMLERLGYQVTSFTESSDALEAFENDSASFDLVISDMTMPNMTGLKLAQKLLSIRPEIPIIICTGYSEKLSRENAASIGIKDILIKPVAKSEVAKTVRRALDHV
jgi:PAS domain S-box-containing protein